MRTQKLLSFIVLSLTLSICGCSKTSSDQTSVESETLISSEISEVSSEINNTTSVVNCDGHVFKEEKVREASIVEKGLILKTCEKCGYQEEKYFYDLKEFAFEDKTFMYDGNEREILIEGLLPYGTYVSYENNKLTEIDTKVATAFIYDEDGHLLDTRTAKISIIENIGLPNIKVTTSTGNDPDYRDKTNYTTMTTSVDNCLDKYVINNLAGGIRARGNSTNYDVVSKHPWRLKFNSKVNLLGLNEGQKFKSWVLLASYFDQSLFRDAAALSIGNSLFNYSNNYASSYQHVNFYMNGDYRGVYLLAEQQQANKGRIDIAEPEEGVEGEKVGYLVEIDIRAADDDPYFTCGPKSTRDQFGHWSGGQMINGVRVVSSTYAIKSDTFGDKQAKYIEKYVANAMDALINAVTGKKLQIISENNELIDSPYDNQYDTLNSFLDLESFFKMCVLHELVKNYDVGYGSFYLFVDFSLNSKHPRLTFGAPWDFDLSQGNKNSGNITKTNNEFIKSGFGEANFNPWLYLLSQTDFYNELIKKYYAVFASSNVFEKTVDYIEYETTAFKTDFANNIERWKNGTGKDRMDTRQYSSHSAAVEYLLDWLSKRKTYMDGVYLA